MSTSAQPASAVGSVIAILMPQAGNSMEEGTILQWRVKPGDRVAVGQILYEVETDKASVEVEATDAGRLARIVAPEGAVVPVKQAVAYLAESDAELEAFLAGPQSEGTAKKPEARSQKPEFAETHAPSEAAHPSAAARTESGRVKASPAARKLAAEKGLDLARVAAGSGPGGRILTTDLAGLEQQAAAKKPDSAARRPLSKMRRAIAANLQMSKQTVPHFYVRQTIDAGPLMTFYRAQKPATGCTLNDVIVLAVGKAVGEIPAFRSRIEGAEIVEAAGAHIGVAVSVDDGLVVPVVLGVDTLSLAQLSAEARRIIEAARHGKIENLGKAVFTISNMGMLGVEEFAAIINPPESGILAVGAIREGVIVRDGAMYARRILSLTLSVDHRVVDGALAAAFMVRLKQLLESPAAHLA
jgi:pyruvate dehydrogenase E2 component (dihydrolipoamide acetyltransferase)